MEKKTICVDFDGVIAQYDGFKGNDIFGDPIDGVQSAMEVLKKKGFTIIIFTTRTASSKLKKYLNDNHITYDYINENPDQPKGSILSCCINCIQEALYNVIAKIFLNHVVYNLCFVS